MSQCPLGRPGWSQGQSLAPCSLLGPVSPHFDSREDSPGEIQNHQWPLSLTPAHPPSCLSLPLDLALTCRITRVRTSAPQVADVALCLAEGLALIGHGPQPSLGSTGPWSALAWEAPAGSAFYLPVLGGLQSTAQPSSHSLKNL